MSATVLLTDQEAADLKTIMRNVEAFSKPNMVDNFASVLEAFDDEDQVDLLRFVIATARYGLDEHQR